MDTPKSTIHMTEKHLDKPPDISRLKMEENEDLADIHDSVEEMGRKCKLSIFPAKHFVSHVSTSAITQEALNEEPELVLHHDDFPHLKVGDIVEIYQPDVDSGTDDVLPRLLLKVYLTQRKISGCKVFVMITIF